jgi:hypothetical protein
MAHVTVISRTEVAFAPDLPSLAPAAEIAFSTEHTAPTRVYLPMEFYRPATLEERAQNPRYGLYPKDAAAEASERDVVSKVIDMAYRTVLHKYEV